ncbi:MAG: immunity protein [Bacteroidetes bacterium]|nr:immunity protein [Bacteroidota bacterium]
MFKIFDFTNGPSIGTTKLTILPYDTTPETLGQTLRKHFNLTEHSLKYQQTSETWKAYKKAAGFKTNKETYQDARNVTCRQSINEIVLTPTENKYNTGFDHRPDLNIHLSLFVSDFELGIQLRKAKELSNG